METVPNYLKNLTKSFAYSAMEVTKSDLIPNTGEFVENNREFFTTTYALLRNPKPTIRKGINYFMESKVYKAIDYGAKNLFEDLRTGKFYNKEREDQSAEKGMSSIMSGWDDMSEFGIDDDWEAQLDKRSNSNEVTTGDLKIADAIEGSNAAVASATVNAVAVGSDVIVKTNRANIGVLYQQNEKLFGGLHSDLSVINATMDSLLKLSAQSFENIDKNSAGFFTEELKLSNERNAILKEMLEMQRNNYKTALQHEQDQLNNKKKKLRFGDINVAGLPDFGEYFQVIKKNISDQLGAVSGFANIFGGEGDNALMAMMGTPLKDLVVEPILKGMIPTVFKMATSELDEMVSRTFSGFLARMGNARENETGGPMEMLSKIFGVNTSVNKGIDTSRYNKGAVPFDGITRKAITDVIPTYLRRIEAAISGREEMMFDYGGGRWVTAAKIKEEFDAIHTRARNSGTAEIMEQMNPYIRKMRNGMAANGSGTEVLKSFDKAIEEFRDYIYNNRGDFNGKNSAEANGISSSNYKNLAEHYEKIRTIYNNFDIDMRHNRDKDSDATEIDKNGKKKEKSLGRHTKNSARMMHKPVLEARDSEERQYRMIEQDPTNIFAQYFSAPKTDVHGKWVSNDDGKKVDFKASNILLSTKDKFGNIFDYLNETLRELRWQRNSGFSNIQELLSKINESGGMGGGPTPPPNGNRKKKRGRGRGVWLPGSQRYSDDNTPPVLKGFDLGERPVSSSGGTQQNDIERRIANDKSLQEKALTAIKNGTAYDIRDFDRDEQLYLLNLAQDIAADASKAYDKEITEIIDASTLKSFMDKTFYLESAKNRIKSEDGLDEEIEKLDKKDQNKMEGKEDEEDDKDDEKDEKEESFFEKLKKGWIKAKDQVGKVVGAPVEVFTNLLYTADRAIYDMFFKHKIDDDDEDDDKDEYDGFMDMVTGKVKNTFKGLKDIIIKDVIDPIKKRLNLGDDTKDRFVNELKDIGKRVGDWFVDGNKETWSPVINTIKSELGMESDENILLDKRKKARSKIEDDIKYLDEAKYTDTRLWDLAKAYKLNPTEYTSKDPLAADLRALLENTLMEHTKEGKEFDNLGQLDLLIRSLREDEDIERTNKVAENAGVVVNGENLNDLINNLSSAATTKFKLTESGLLDNKANNKILSEIGEDKRYKNSAEAFNNIIDNFNIGIHQATARNDRTMHLHGVNDVIGSSTEDKLKYIKRMPSISKDAYDDIVKRLDSSNEFISTKAKSDLDNIIADDLRDMTSSSFDNFAKGTVGKPFKGDTMLSEGELLFDSKGMSVVKKTDAYHLNEPTHILSSYDSNPILEMMGMNPGRRRKPEEDLKEENRVKKNLFANNAFGTNRIANHAEGDDKKEETKDTAEKAEAANNDKVEEMIDNEVDKLQIDNKNAVGLKDVKENIKKFLPEGAAGGLIGGVMALLLGTVGGPLVGAGIGAAASIVRHSDSLKNKLFGEVGDDGKRKGGIISKKIIDKVTQYVPSIAKFGAAGIIPGLLTPLGPIGGLLVGGAVGFLKSNERLNEKYFGKEGMLTFSDKTKSMIKKVLPKMGIGAGIGAAATLFGGPFGLFGNAVLGAGVGLMASSDEFKDLLLGKEVDGERVGGVAGALKTAFEPLKDFGKELVAKFEQILDDNIITPLKQFAEPFVNAVPRVLTWPVRKLNQILEDKIGKGLDDIVRTYMVDPLIKATKFLLKPFSMMAKVATSPLKLLGATGNWIRKRQLGSGNADYMTAEERNKFRASRKGSIVHDRFQDFDLALANIGKQKVDEDGNVVKDENGNPVVDFTLEQAKELKENIGLISRSHDSLKAEQQKAKKAIKNSLWKNVDDDGASISSQAKTQLYKVLNKESIKDPKEAVRQAKEILTTYPLKGSRRTMTEEEAERFLNKKIKGDKSFTDELTSYIDVRNRKNALDNMTDEEKSLMTKDITEKLKGLGVKDLNIKKGDLSKIEQYLDTEITHLETMSPEKKANSPKDIIYGETEVQQLQSANSTLSDIKKALMSIVNGESVFTDMWKEQAQQGSEEADQAAKERYDDAKDYAKAAFGNSRWNSMTDEQKQQYLDEADGDEELAKQNVGEKEWDNLDDKTKDSFTSFDSKKKKKEYLIAGQRKAPKMYMNQVATALNRGDINSQEAKMMGGTGNPERTILIKNLGYNITTPAMDNLMGMTDTEFDTLYKRLDNKQTRRFVNINANGALNIPDIKFITDQSSQGFKEFKNTVKYHYKNGTLTKFRHMQDLMNLKIKKSDEEDDVDVSTTTDRASETVGSGNFEVDKDGEIKEVENTEEEVEDAEDEAAGTEEEVDEEPEEDIENNAFGTIFKFAKKGIKKLFGRKKRKKRYKKKKKSQASANENIEEVTQAPEGGPQDYMNGGGGSVINSDGDTTTVIDPATGEGYQVKRDPDGSTSPDMTDPQTKEVVEGMKKRTSLQEKFHEMQEKTGNIFKDIFGTEDVEGSENGKIKWWQLLLTASFIKGTGIFDGLFENVVKPVWTKHIYPFITDKAVPWITDVAFPKIESFIFDKAIPTLVSGFTQLTSLLLKELPIILFNTLTTLPKFICEGVKNAISNIERILGRKTEKAEMDLKDKADDELVNLYDKDGNQLTKAQALSGKYEVYNEANQLANIDADMETAEFEEKSQKGKISSFKTLKSFILNPMTAFTKGRTFFGKAGMGLIKNIDKGLKFIAKKGGLIGRVATTPLRAMTGTAKIAAKAGKEITEHGLKQGAKNVVKAATENESLAGKLFGKLVSAWNKLKNFMMGSKTIVSKTAKAAAAEGGEKAVKKFGIKAMCEFIDKAITKVGAKALAKGVKKIGTKVVKGVLNKLPLLGAIMSAYDFIDGCNKAEAILGVSETTLIEEIICGVINLIGNQLIVPAMLPNDCPFSIGWFTKLLIDFKQWAIGGKSIEERQKEADKEWEEYKAETGDAVDKETYLKEEKSWFGRFKRGWRHFWHGKAKEEPKEAEVEDVSTESGEGTNKEKPKSKYGTGTVFMNGQEPQYGMGESHITKKPTITGDKFKKLFSKKKDYTGGAVESLLNPIKNIFESLTNVDPNETDQTIDEATDGKVSIFSNEYWDKINTTKSGFAGTLQSAVNGFSLLIHSPIILIKNLFDKVKGNFADLIDYIGKFKGDDVVLEMATDEATNDSSSSGEGSFGRGGAKQIDPAISNIRYNVPGDTQYQTIGDSGCGPAAAVSAVSSVYGRGASDVVNAANFALKRGYKEKNGGTTPGFFKDYFASQGLSSQTTSDRSTLMRNIASGKPTVLMGSDPRGVSNISPYGSSPHYVTATGMDRHGNIVVQDPESKYDNQLYKANDLLSRSSFGVSAFGKNYGRGKNLGYIIPNKNMAKYFKQRFGTGKWGRATTTLEEMNNLYPTAKGIYLFFVSKGMYPAAACGVIGNLYQESRFRPEEVTGSHKGVGQWDSGRYANLVNYASSKGKNPGDLQTQLEFIILELKGEPPASDYTNHVLGLKIGTYEDFCTLNDVDRAVEIFEQSFERSGGQDMNVRYQVAEYYLPKLVAEFPETSDGTNYQGYYGNLVDGTNGANINKNNDFSSNNKAANTTGQIGMDTVNNFRVMTGRDLNNGGVLGKIANMFGNAVSNSNMGQALSSLGNLINPYYEFFFGSSEVAKKKRQESTSDSNSSSQSSTNKTTTTSGEANTGASVANTVGQLPSILQDLGQDSIADVAERSGLAPYGSAAQLIYRAIGELGTYVPENGSNKYGQWYGDDNQPWCAQFVSYNANNAKIPEDVILKYEGTKAGYQWFADRGQILEDKTKGSPGDIAFMTSNASPSGIHHTGIVENVSSGIVHTIEGNSSNKAQRRSYNAVDPNLFVAKVNYTVPSQYTFDPANAANVIAANGGNGEKPVSKYGVYKEHLYGSGKQIKPQPVITRSSSGEKVTTVISPMDMNQEQIAKYGKATRQPSINYTALIEAIINILSTIASNTGKIDLIASILNEKLNANISVKDTTSENKESLRNKLKAALLARGSNQMNSNYSGGLVDSSDNAIIAAVNAIASE